MKTQTDCAGSRQAEKITIGQVAGELLRISRMLKTKADALIKQFGPTIKYGDAMFELMRDAVREAGAILQVAADEGLLDAAAAKIAATYPSDQVSWLVYLGDMQVHYCGASEIALGNPELTAKAIDAIARALLTKVSPKPAAGLDTPIRKVGRLNKQESEARKAELLAKCSAHPTLMNDFQALAESVGVSKDTCRRWLAKFKDKHAQNQKE